MSDNEDKSQTTAFGAIGLLAAKNPLVADSNETEESESKSNEITTNINKDTNEKNEDFDSESIIPDDQNLRSRKSITSGRLINNEENNSTSVIIDSSSNNPPQGPIRSMSESALIDTTEHPPTLPIQQDESSAEDDDDDDDNSSQQQKSLNATARSENTSRTQSASGNEKRTRLSDELDREVANITGRSSKNKSPLNRSRSRTPKDPRKTPTNIESKRVQSSASNDQTFKPPSAIISPVSRRESANKINQKQTSRASSTKKSQLNDNSSGSSTDRTNNDFLTTDDQSKLIKTGEQLQIPINDIENKQLNSPPPSPSTIKQTVLTNPLLDKHQQNSRPTSQSNRKNSTSSSVSNKKLIDGDATSTKSRSSNNANQQRTTTTDQKPELTSIRKGSNTSKNDEKNKNDSRRSSTNVDIPARTSAKQKSPLQKRSAQQSRKNSSNTTDQTVMVPIKINSAKSSQQQNEKRSSATDSDNEQIDTSKLPRIHSPSPSTTPTNVNQTNVWTKQVDIPPLQTTEDELPISRPQSPNVEQIAERNPPNKKRTTNERKKKDLNRRSNSVESFNHIPLVDDKSLDSTSGNNTDIEHPKQRRVKSKKKDVETNTDLHNGNHQQQEITSQKATKSMSNYSPSIRRRIPAVKQQDITTPDTEPDANVQKVRRSVKKSKISNENKDSIDNNENSQISKDKHQVLKSMIDPERHTQSDTEQIISEKQKKRRRPKRISRTTQTYECVFRRMEYEQHEELRPTNDTDKNIQTRRSCLRPRTRSPKRHYPIYLSTDAFKIEEILPKQFPLVQRNNISKTSVIARSNSPQNGKLLILRPTLPFHHTDAVNVQRISLQYAIDLIPNENKSNDLTLGQRNKTNVLKQSEQTNNLPMINSPSSTTTSHLPLNKTNTKEKSTTNKIEDRTYQRKNGGTV